jgi:hypothetical protein
MNIDRALFLKALWLVTKNTLIALTFVLLFFGLVLYASTMTLLILFLIFLFCLFVWMEYSTLLSKKKWHQK